MSWDEISNLVGSNKKFYELFAIRSVAVTRLACTMLSGVETYRSPSTISSGCAGLCDRGGFSPPEIAVAGRKYRRILLGALGQGLGGVTRWLLYDFSGDGEGVRSALWLLVLISARLRRIASLISGSESESSSDAGVRSRLTSADLTRWSSVVRLQ
jgi:hypothetical protein